MEKEQKRNETKEKRPLTEEQRQRRKKMLVYPLMVLTFLGCMWLIFAPSQKDGGKERQGLGFNTDMPQPEDSKIIGDKGEGITKQQQLEKQEEGTPGHGGRPVRILERQDGRNGHGRRNGRLPPGTTGNIAEDGRKRNTDRHPFLGCRQRAAEHLAGTFYEPPKEDAEKKELRQRIDELERMVMEQEKQPARMEEQVALLEKSYELAAKYQNGGNNAAQTARTDGTEMTESNAGEKKMKAEPVSGVRPSTVSALPQPLTDSAFIADYGGERNYGFILPSAVRRHRERTP